MISSGGWWTDTCFSVDSYTLHQMDIHHLNNGYIVYLYLYRFYILLVELNFLNYGFWFSLIYYILSFFCAILKLNHLNYYEVKKNLWTSEVVLTIWNADKMAKSNFSSIVYPLSKPLLLLFILFYVFFYFPFVCYGRGLGPSYNKKIKPSRD